MKNASLWALTGAALVVGIAYACAVPVEVNGCAPGTSGDCDVILSQPSDFEGDASLPAQGGSGGGGGLNPPSGGSSGNNSPPPAGGAGSNSPPSGGSAGQGQAGSGSAAGASGASGGAGAGGAGAGGAGAGGAGAGGAAGSAGSAGAGTAGAAGSPGAAGSGAQSSFDVESCDFVNRAGCEQFACATACLGGDGGYCQNNCQNILTCVAATPTCVTDADPICGVPSQNPYTENACTPQVNNSGSSATPNTPSFVALALVRCLCSDPRP